jgi:hypothetical protein
MTVLADSPLKSYFDLIFWQTFTHLHRWNPLIADDGNKFRWLRSTSGSHIKRQLVYILLPMLLMLGRFVYSTVKSGLVQKLALVVALS